jgi:hypothetical protein
VCGVHRGNLVINVEGLTLKAEEVLMANIETEGGFDYANGYGGITILADGVTIDGFVIEQSVPQAIIHTHNFKDVTISNNIITVLPLNGDLPANGDLPRGIDVGYASAASDRVTIYANWFQDLYCGVYVNQGTDLIINENHFANMDEAAVVFDGTWPIGNVAVTKNSTENARYLLYFLGNVDAVDVKDNILDEDTELAN